MKREQSLTREERMERRERIRRKKRRRLLRKIRSSCITTLFFLLLGIIIWKLSTYILDDTANIFSNETLVIEKPVLRTDAEVLDKLLEIAEKNEDYKKICEHPENYPQAMLTALANNPEMLDFVKGYLDHDGTAPASLTRKEKKEDYPLFLQWDKRWGYAAYGESNIGISGCGPTCLSMVAYALTKDDMVTPDKVAAYSEEQGYYVEGTGTSWSLMTDGAARFDITGTELPLNQCKMEQELDAKHPIICAMGAGDFTTAGHFIVLYGYDQKGFFVNDPNSQARSNKQWTYEELSNQIKNLWYFQ